MKYLLAALSALVLFAASSFGGETLKVGYYYNPPKIFMTPNGHISGVFPEVLEDIAREYDWEISYVQGTWQECLDRLLSGEIDLMVDVAFSEERQKLFEFSKEPVLVNWGTAFSRTDIPIHSLFDMKNRTVAVMKGSIHSDGPQGIKSIMSELDIPCSFVEVDDYEEVLMLLDSRQADIGIVNNLFGTLRPENYDVLSTPIVFNPCKLLFCAKKGSERGKIVLAKIDESLHEAKQNPDSVYHRALVYYLGGGTREEMGEARQYTHPLHLKPEELQWISDHPQIRISIDPEFTPFEFLSTKNEYRGIAADFIDLITQKTGIKFELVRHKTWSESIQAAREGKVDILPCIGESNERRKFLSFSEPYLKFARVIVSTLNSPIKSLDDLQDLKVAVQADSSHHAFLKEHTTIKPQLYKTYRECLLAVSSGEADATVGNLAVTTHFMRDITLTNLMMAAYASSEPQSLSMGVRKDWPELTGILNKTLQSMSIRERNAIFSRWLQLPKAAPDGIELSSEEREWLLMHPRIKIAWDPSWAPVEFAGKDGKPKGISMEYLNAIEGILGIQFEKNFTAGWEESYGKLKTREHDMSACLAVTPERLEHLTFTEPYLTSPVVFFARGYAPYIRGFSELKDNRVAVVGGYATDAWISRDYPDLNIIRTPTIADGFNMLRKGEVDVFVCSVIPGTYYLSEQRYHDIKVAGETPYSYKIRMAVRKDWPLFAGILQKAMDSIAEVDKNAFFRKWISIKYENKLDYALLGKVVLGALAVIFAFFYWNRRLSSEISSRKRAQEALSESEKALRESYTDLKKLEEMKENLTHMIVHDMRSPLLGISGSLELLLMDIHSESPGENIEDKLLVAHASTQKLMCMAQALLDIGRLEAGRMPLNTVDINMTDAVAAAISAMEIQAKLADVRLLQSGEIVLGKADQDIIHRVLINLIGNAIKASPKGAAVEVHTKDEDSQMIVEVCDSGRGIPKKLQHTLFDKFTSIEDGESGRGSVGLGLAFCKLAIEAHGGNIEVESDEGKGSIFRFKIMKK